MAVTYGSNLGNTAVSPAPSVNAVGIVFPADAQWAGHLYGYNPKRYSGKVLRKFYETCILPQISNTDYQGEIKDYGDTVIIRTSPDIQVKNYVKGMDLTYDVYDTDVVTLTIDKGKYWAFVTNPVDQKQTDIKSFVDQWTSDAARRIKIAIEKEAFEYLITQVDQYNSGGAAGKVSGAYNLGTVSSPRAITASTAIGIINDCGSCLGEYDIPVLTETCWMVVTQKVANILAASPLYQANVMGDQKSLELRGGQFKIPHLDCFDIYTSNLLPAVENNDVTVANAAYILFGHRDALTFAAQLTENEALPNPKGFGTLHRGLTIYGYKVIQQKCLGMAVVGWSEGGLQPLSLSAYAASLSSASGHTTASITASNVATGGTLVAVSSDTTVASVAVSNSTITITRVGTTAGTCIVSVTDGATVKNIAVTNAANG